ncbi:hypothetical protein ABFX02_02G106900 [Erythranthe guttata]
METSPPPPPPPPHIAILPTPGIGHLIPLVEFAKKLHHRHFISTTFIIPTDGPLSTAQTTFLSALPSAVDYLLLPPVNLDDLPPDVRAETRIAVTVTRSLPSIHDAVKSLHASKSLSALVVDLFGTDAFESAVELNIPPYIFFPSTAMTLSLFFHLPELDRTVSSEYRDVHEKLQIPGCAPIHGRDLIQPVQDRTSDAYQWVLRHAKRYRMAEGIVVNTFQELEPGPVRALLVKENGKPDVYAIGPLIKMGSSNPEINESDAISVKFLDGQPNGSVLYVSFGSGGDLSHDQIVEIAHGLEKSGQRFLWVLRCPNANPNASYFDIQSSGDPLAYLPQGFLERTQDRGLVVPLWAPQAQILTHKSICAFLTHCGWNSVLESVSSGVPMIAWPLYAEQGMNAVMLHEDVRVALRPRVGENGLIVRDEVARVVKGLMEGEAEEKEIRGRIRDLKDAAANSLSENGTSTKFLDELAEKWKRNNSCK